MPPLGHQKNQHFFSYLFLGPLGGPGKPCSRKTPISLKISLFWPQLEFPRSDLNEKKVYIPVFHGGGHCGLRSGHVIDFLAIFWKSLKTREIDTSMWKFRNFEISNPSKILFEPAIVFGMLMSSPASKPSQTPLKTWFWANFKKIAIFKNRDFQKSVEILCK